ncbi:hypothetical protein WMY93_024829 [Mugilogobius chulae]|uniref:Uncharacterized protein n=1 Tax=Mugilogobius chulae TaxID=88201 RepID=A0AAW0N537_9GOBI
MRTASLDCLLHGCDLCSVLFHCVALQRGQAALKVVTECSLPSNLQNLEYDSCLLLPLLQMLRQIDWREEEGREEKGEQEREGKERSAEKKERVGDKRIRQEGKIGEKEGRRERDERRRMSRGKDGRKRDKQEGKEQRR